MNKHIVVTGSLGLIGYETTLFYLKKGYAVLGIDNDLRAKLFRIKTQYNQKLKYLNENYSERYLHFRKDIRDLKFVTSLFKKYRQSIDLIIHTAAQTSHDWAKNDPLTDYSINADATLYLLEAFRQYSPNAVFIFTSTNKVYGDLVNGLDFEEFPTRYDFPKKSSYYNGISESFSVDNSTHSLFGVSKTSADLLVQEYGRYFSLKTGVFRLGVITGVGQSGTFYQGFLSYLIDAFVRRKSFAIVGYKGKQVRDILHARDLVSAFYLFSKKPGKGQVYNLGGGRVNSASVVELINKISHIVGYSIKTKHIQETRRGDHKWWITDNSKFCKSYPQWKIENSVDDIILEMRSKKE